MIDATFIAKTSQQMSADAGPQLLVITEAALIRHGTANLHLSQDLIMRIGLTLNEVQDQSFLLGVAMAFKLVAKLNEDAVKIQ